MKSFKKVLILHLFIVIFTWVAVIDVHAHRVTIFAWIDGDTIHTQSKFGGGKRVNNGEVSVFDPEGNLLLKGNTDENGEFSFKVPEKISLKIELNAGMGHQGQWIVPAEEIGALQQDSYVASDRSEDVNQAAETKSEPVVTAPGLTREDIEQAVEQAVEKKLKPVMQMLSELSEPGPRISDILGGIGYILGLVGIGAYIKTRKKTDSQTR
jgi:nickel transport protein